jgi:protein-tyrosine phosphatase
LPAHFLVAADLPGRLTIMPCPTGDDLEDQFASLAQAGITRIISMLAPDEAGLLGVASETRLCADAGIAFENHPIVDFGLPDQSAFRRLVAHITDHLQNGAHVAIHCRAGIGRSGMVASAVLIRLGYAPEQAIEKVSIARGVSIPDTIEQRQFILGFAP